MEFLRLNLLVTAISCLAILAFPIFVTGCGDSGDDDDDSISDTVVAPDPEPVSEATPQPVAQPEPEPPPQAEQEQPAQQEPEQPQPEQPQPEPPPQPAPEPAVSFQGDILPILQASCAVQGCHAAPNPPKGLNLETYADFERGNVFNPGDSNGSEVIRRIDGGGMPPGAPLAEEQIQLFKDWIDEGAENN